MKSIKIPSIVVSFKKKYFFFKLNFVFVDEFLGQKFIKFVPKIANAENWNKYVFTIDEQKLREWSWYYRLFLQPKIIELSSF